MCCFSSTHLRVKTVEVLSSSFSHPRTVIARSTLQDTMTATNVITHTVKERGREREGGGEREEERGRGAVQRGRGSREEEDILLRDW